MHFFTLFPYLGIIVLIILNAVLVLKRDITVDEQDHRPEH